MSDVAIIHSGKDGELETTTTADIDAMVKEIGAKQKAVLHFHGGLVNEAGGRKVAASLNDTYREAGALPVFFVWESGLIEVLSHNIAEIAGEDFFKIVLKYVTRFAAGKLGQATDAGGKAVGTVVPMTEVAYRKELSRRDQGAEPFVNVPVAATVPELSPQEQEDFRRRLAEDTDFLATVEAIVDEQHDEAKSVTGKGVVTRVRVSTRTLMDPEAVKALAADNAAAKAAGGKGILSTAKAVKAAVTILVRVISRFRRGRDHGLYPTVVEEILREFYVANAGGRVWGAMKKETSDTFGAGQKPRAGTYFLDKLSELVKAGTRPELTLVGHSTGAVFINNMLREIAKRRTSGALPADFRIKNVVFLAGACTMDDFVDVIARDGKPPLYENLRVFAMTDQAESADALVPYVYTRSLLYFVSGVVEQSDGKSAEDQPLVGMERYFTREKVYAGKNENDVRAHVKAHARRAVWSPTSNAGPGLRCGAKGHTQFDEDKETLESLVHLIRDGF